MSTTRVAQVRSQRTLPDKWRVTTGADVAHDWMAARGWSPAPFQQQTWEALARGDSGLLHASTGSGKTLAVWLGVLQALLRPPTEPQAVPAGRSTRPLSVLWITPMRALAADTTRALAEPMTDLAPAWTLGLRSGDTPSAERARQDRRMPTVLVTTPESLSVLLSREQAPAMLAGVSHVVVDEWHELLGSKRGVQVQLALARLRHFRTLPHVLRCVSDEAGHRAGHSDAPPAAALVVWGLSATLGNMAESAQVLCGPGSEPVLVRGMVEKPLCIDTLVPGDPGRYSWAGHLGARMLGPVVEQIAAASTSLVFTNTRSQAEIWYQLLLQARPDWAGEIALHHGSLDQEVRAWVEAGLKAGRLKAVVATSSLDLGVDFLPVERVLQIGSAKGVARLLQRAGRSGHAPGRPSRITLVPTNTMELVEAVAARQAALAGRVEQRSSPEQPLDVLVQHLVTAALGGGFDAAAMALELKSTWAYRQLEESTFAWAMAFCQHGGDSLTAYPDYHRIADDGQGVWRVPTSPAGRAIARRHRMGIGTIVSDAAMQVKYLNGQRIGSVEEGFIARLRRGDCFVFAGRLLELVRVQALVAYVKKAQSQRGAVSVWQGGSLPLSGELADAVLAVLDETSRVLQTGVQPADPELQAALPMLRTQAAMSCLPGSSRLLVETLDSRDGHHLYVYPFAGRHVHNGLANLLAWRLAREHAQTFSLSVNDYGFELLSAEPFVNRARAMLDGAQAWTTEGLLDDVLASLNAGELAQRRFREIARVAGLVFGGYPGAPTSLRQLQASSALFYEVFRQYDPGNRLLEQARQEALSQELDFYRLQRTLERLQALPVTWVALPRSSPMSLPLMVERLRARVSTEQLAQRLGRLLRELGEPA